jgi:hypothetical protein
MFVANTTGMQRRRCGKVIHIGFTPSMRGIYENEWHVAKHHDLPLGVCVDGGIGRELLELVACS